MTKWRFIDSVNLSAYENMHIDESLLSTCSDKPIFRLYTWKPNSFTIGRFQDINSIKNPENYGDNFAKRITGGGLLLHGFDVSYTMIIPIKLLGKKSVKDSYEYICTFILNSYKKLNLDVNWAKDLPLHLSKSFFCQEGFEPYDMICENKKIGGNAQKRTKEFVLQHGSIPLVHDNRDFAGHSLDEFGINLSPIEAKELLKQSFKETFNAILEKESL